MCLLSSLTHQYCDTDTFAFLPQSSFSLHHHSPRLPRRSHTMSLARMKYNGYIHPIPVLYSPAILPYNLREMNPTLIHRSNLRILSRLASSKIRHTHVELYRLITHLGHSSMAQQWSIVVGTKNGQVWLWYPTANPRFLRLRYLKIVSGKNCL